MKTTAVAPANIAFIKYWGKADEKLRLPLNSSISMNLSNAVTKTTVEFSPSFSVDSVEVINGEFSDEEKSKIVNHLDRIRKRAKSSFRAKVATHNSFPKGAGIASSASGFAALTVAASSALGLHFSEKELTILARLGSGSASRSIPDGFVVWKTGESSEDSYAYSLYPSTYWDLRDIILIVDPHEKSVSTTAAMDRVQTSPFWKDRVMGIGAKMQAVQYALKHKNLGDLGVVIEEDCVNMHAVAMTQNPPVFYWNDATVRIREAVRMWRQQGVRAFYTIDAGPNVHLICEGKDENVVTQKARVIDGVKHIIINKPARGTRLVEDHLF